MSRHRVGSNVSWNVAGQLLPGLVALVTVPPLIHSLGAERFGLLTIAWIVMGYFSLFDLGLSRATTSSIAASAAAEDRGAMEAIVTSSLAAHTVIGIVGGVALALVSPLLVNGLTLSASLVGEARAVFLLLAVSVPMIVTTASLRGVLEGLHRFDQVNVVKIAASTLNFVAPLVVLRWSPSLTIIVAVILAGRALTLVAHAMLVRGSLPLLRGKVSWAHIRPMLGFGGWLTVSSTLAPASTALDRFAIGSRIATAAVTAYATPYEILSRIYIASSSLMGVMFPLYSAMAASGRQNELQSASRASARALLIVTAAPIVLLMASADVLLTAWVGRDLANASTSPARILLAGALINTVAQAPVTLLQAAGRADIVARRQVFCFLLYVPAVWFVAARGVAWVAGAWALRIAIESLLMFIAEGRFHGLASIDGSLAATVVAAAIGLALPFSVPSVAPRLAIATVIAIIMTLAMWRFLLNANDRARATATIRAALGRMSGAR